MKHSVDMKSMFRNCKFECDELIICCKNVKNFKLVAIRCVFFQAKNAPKLVFGSPQTP